MLSNHSPQRQRTSAPAARASSALGPFANTSDANILASAVRQNDRAANLLVSVTGVNAQLYMQLDGLIELSLSGRNNGCKRLSGIVQLGTVYQSLRSLHTFYLCAQ